MKRLWFILAAAVIGSGCATDPKSDSPDDADKISGLSMSLTSTDSQGRPYRLRNATFTVQSQYYGYPWGYGDGGAVPAEEPVVLSTETDPDSDHLSVRLVPGEYSVSLGGDWYIERLTANGIERVQQVVLLTDAVQYAYVGDNWNYDLNYRFGVDGTLIDFRHGDLNINVGIELPGDNDYAYDGGYPGSTQDAGVSVLDAGAVIIN